MRWMIQQEFHDKLDEKCRSMDLNYYDTFLRKDSFFAEDRQRYPIAYLLLQGTLFSHEGISTKELEQFSHLSYMTLKKRLDDMAQHGYLLIQSSGREKQYRLHLERLEK